MWKSAGTVVGRPGRTSRTYLATGIVLAIVGILGGVFVVVQDPKARMADAILAGGRDHARYAELTIRYPLDGTLFPPEIVPPTFRWEHDGPGPDIWLVTIEFQDGGRRRSVLVHDTEWTPGPEEWETIKKRSSGGPAKVTILGANQATPKAVLLGASISIETSEDPVGAPLFYREVNLPFRQAVMDPSHIRWRFGTISSPEQPPVVLTKLPVCGNCHSFSTDGRVLGMDVDYASDKGSYAIAPVAEEMVLGKGDIITWSDYQRTDEKQTFGLLSQISPDGRHVVSTVKDRSVFVAKPDLAFSQLFFPIQGILCVYSREDEAFRALPGADDPVFVQSNPAWSPDGKHIVFARSKAHHLKNIRDDKRVLLTPEECAEFLEGEKTFLFDLYRVPFNDGKGGKPIPIEGASSNGMSNYFAKYSPDGKWIVFCKAKSFMLLQPDSELYIIPAEGGQARRLRCNTDRMNSWHSWSPNSRWLVFSSKANSPYTQLFLTHIDDQGRSTPPVVLSHFTSPDRAANIPEFVNAAPAAIASIRQQFVDDESYLSVASRSYKVGDFRGAVKAYRKALELNPDNAVAHLNLGKTMTRMGKVDEAIRSNLEALRVKPDYAEAHVNVGLLMVHQEKFDEGGEHFAKGAALQPELADVPAATMARQAAQHAQSGRFREAAFAAEKAFCLARAAGNSELAERMKKLIGRYKKGGSGRPAIAPPSGRRPLGF